MAQQATTLTTTKPTPALSITEKMTSHINKAIENKHNKFLSNATLQMNIGDTNPPSTTSTPPVAFT